MQPQFITLPYRADNLANQTFSRLTALGPTYSSPRGVVFWFCQCECGNTAVVRAWQLRSGKTKSCGCFNRDTKIARLTKHGMSKTRIHSTWQNMVSRCHVPANKSYPYYGARGIFVCDEWRHDFLAYHDHVSQLPNYGEKGYTLDRIDNSLGYSPGNVRYATRTEQMRNTRQNILLTYNGKTQCLAAWAEETNIKCRVLSSRLQLGWSPEKILTTPIDSTHIHPKR